MANEITGLSQPALQPAQARPVANAPVGAQPQAGGVPAASDTLTLTDSGRLMQRLEAAVADAPRVDGQRIARIKEQIANGTYHVDPDQVAAQVVQLERDLNVARTDNGYTWTMTTDTARGTRERTVTVGYDAETQSITRERTTTRANGDQVTRDGGIQRTEDGFTSHSIVTGPNGVSIYREVDQSYDPANQSWTRVVSQDGVNHDFMRTTQVALNDSGEVVAHKTVVDPLYGPS